MSTASSSESRSAWLTSGWSGISRAPWKLPWHAAASGNAACSRSSAYMRPSWFGTRAPARFPGPASASVALERDDVHGRHDAEAPLRLRQVTSDLLGRRAREAIVALQQLDGAVQLAFP